MGDRQPLAADVLAAGAGDRNRTLFCSPFTAEGGRAYREWPGTRPG
jgi:hypothetical protein